MSPGLIDEWRSEWRLRRGAASYVASLMREPEPDDVAWFATAATGGDDDRARWELRYARRALGLIVAQREALDDRTAQGVARELATALHNDRHVAAAMVKTAERQFNDRLGAYREVLSTRTPKEGTGARLGRALLRMADAPAGIADEIVAQAGEVLVRYVGDANESLRKAFGTVTLPDDLPPSALAGRGR
jgi:hypothetical protein